MKLLDVDLVEINEAPNPSLKLTPYLNPHLDFRCP